MKMGLLVPMDTACCGCHIKSLSLLFLYLHLVFTITSFSDISTEITPEQQNATEEYINRFVPRELPNRDAVIKSYIDTTNRVYEWFLDFEFLNRIVSLVIISSCLYGIHARKASFMVPWVVYHGVVLALFGVLFLFLIIVVFAITVTVGAPTFTFLLIIVIPSLILGIWYYIFLIVYNCYLQTNERNEAFRVMIV